MKFAITSKGCSEYRLIVQGKSCHSSKPREGVNAICITAKLVDFIENLNNEFSTTTLNCGIIQGGDIVNRVPDNCSLTFDLRTEDKCEQTLALDKISKYCVQLQQKYLGSRIEMEKLLKIPPFKLENNKLIALACNKFNTTTERFSGGCEAGYFTDYSGDAVIYGVGDTSLCHQANENLSIDDYLKYQTTLIEFINLVINITDKNKILTNILP